MSRGIGTTNETQVDSAHVYEVILVKLEFDTPVYVHSGIGTISYGGNDYLGVGHYGGVTATRESEALGPSEVTLTLDGITANNITEALDSGNLYDPITIYGGFRQDDGTLVADPYIIWKGWYEYAQISVGEQSSVSITCQHDLAVLNEKGGDRYSDEDQQDKYTGDVGFEFVADMANVKLIWGGQGIASSGGIGAGGERRLRPRIR